MWLVVLRKKKVTMVPTSFLRCTVVYAIIVCFVFDFTSNALVVTSPTLDGNGILTTTEREGSQTKIERLNLDLRIRSTNERDIKEITNMLTYALLEEDGVGAGAAKRNKQHMLSPLNFKCRNIRSGVAPLLESRMNAMKTKTKGIRIRTSKMATEMKKFK